MAATVDPRHRLIEGVATDGQTVWVSSVLDRTILECRESCQTLAVLPATEHPLGIAWDSKRERLWVAADCPKLPGVTPCERGALVALDRRGRLTARLSPATGAFHPGDVSASATGDVFVSDSENGAVYRLPAAGAALTALVEPGVGKSAQGSALDASGTLLIVADYSHGIGTVDLESGERTILKRADGRPIRGIDGLLRCGGRYLAIYNGQPPGALIRFKVDGERIDFEEIGGASLVDPTQLASDGKRLLIVSNAGWEAAAKAAERTEPASILSVALPEPC